MADNTIALQVKTPTIAESPISTLLDWKGKLIQNQQSQLDLDRAKELYQAKIKQGQAESQQAQTQAKQSQFKLQGDQATVGINEATALLQDPRIKENDPTGTINALNEAKARMIAKGVPQDTADYLTSHFMSHAEEPGAVSQMLQNAIRGNAGAGTQANIANAPLSTVNTGSAIQPVQLQPGAPNAIQPGTQIPTTIAPSERQGVSYNPVTGSPVTTTKDNAGNVVGITPTPSTGAAPQLAVGDKDAIPVLSQEREAARTQLAAAPNMHENNRIILSNIDKTTTGAAGPALQRMASVLGVGLTGSESTASAYDLVGKALERNAIQQAQSMGPQTNAGLESQIIANGSVHYNPTAIKTITKLNDAIVSGTEAYQPGLEKAIASSPNGVLAKRQYDQQWAQNFDPKIMMIYNAKKSGDTAEVNKIINELGGKNSAGVKTLMQKAQNLHQLSQTGSLQ